ncbi:MAG TPA: GNAT family N-acetyltransferase [Candidatus Krumholzibacteria bacterium]|nr:GNAT family N-acetyltransferase [Candidatus Krumholzibacteria bacterium]
MTRLEGDTPRRDEYRTIAGLHAAGITEGFLSTLGEPFLAALYRGIAGGRDSGVIVARENGRVLGFISWARDVKGCYRSVLLRRGLALAWALLPNALRPAFYRKVFQTLRYPADHGGLADGGAAAAPAIRPELLSMAVSSEARGKGVGKFLVAAVDDAMRGLGLPGYYVVTHAVDPRSTGFYAACGFAPTRTFTSHGKPMQEFFKTLG